MKILGIDPGLAITGYGLIEAGSCADVKLLEAGVIRTSYKMDMAGRLKIIYGSLDAVMTEFKPDVLVLEKLYAHYKHPITAILMGHSRGIICLLCGLKNIGLVNYPATRVKKAITGSGAAAKEQVQRSVADALKLKKCPEPVDVTDALALALAYVHIEFKKQFRGMSYDKDGVLRQS